MCQASKIRTRKMGVPNCPKIKKKIEESLYAKGAKGVENMKMKAFNK